ncbi:MAG: diguanylate cyclase [Chitinivibrionales bacterium]|nr:diguanylate cyclase [Chitinivibrionales bacterium]
MQSDNLPGPSTHRMHKEHDYIRVWLTLLVLASIPIAVWHLDNGNAESQTRHHIYWLLAWLPYALFGILAFLGAQLNQTRIVYVIGTMTVGYALLRFGLGTSETDVPLKMIIYASSMALPLGTQMVLPLTEGRLFSIRSLLRAVVCLIPWLFLLIPAAIDPHALSYVFYSSGPFKPVWHLPFMTLPILLISGVLILLVRDHSMRFFNRAALVGFVPLQFSLNQASASPVGHPEPASILAVGFTSMSLMFGYALYRMYWEKAYIDDLTGLPNRRSLNEKLDKLGRRYTVAMLDIDHFKRLNDTYGHTTGDHVLRFVASHLQRAFGTRVYRYGGEEFCVLFDSMPMRTAANMQDSFRRYLETQEFVVRSTNEIRQKTSQRDRGGPKDETLPRLHITLSAGLAYRDIPVEKPEEIIELADKALYAAKQRGRNRVLCYGPLD